MSSEQPESARLQIDGYRILRVIGHGGMSTVYLGEQISLSRKVALKVMLPEALADEVSRGRFENEARTIARLQHPHIVSIHEVGRTRDGLPFYSMPHLPRGHLAQRDLRGDQPRVASILRPLLQALDYAHVRGVVHRDVKAENVLFDENERPQLADFGIALRRGSNPRLTSTGLAVGSTAYMPPEQARGAEVDRRADLYSLGVLAWEMLTGRLPYNAADALSMAMMHAQDPIPRLPASLRHWQPFIDKAMAKKPDHRFSSAIEMLEALDELERRSGRAFGRVDVPRPSPGQVAASKQAWKPVSVALAGLALAAFAIAMWNHQRSSPTTPTKQPAASQVIAEEDALPAPQPGAQTGVLGAIEETPEPGAGAAYIANAEQQLRAGQLLAPANANAWDSWDAAWRIDPTRPQVQLLTASLFDALSDASERAMREGNIIAAGKAFRHAQQLDARRGGDGSAIALLRTRLFAALDSRLSALVAKSNLPGAERLLSDTGWLELDATRGKALQARLAIITRATAPVASAGTRARPAAASNVEIVTVSRDEYARFVAATTRTSAACGRSSMFGRKRTWSAPGDRQGSGAPVVCVSAGDAQAYAAWRSSGEPGSYRLPSAGELKAQPAAVSGWLTLCADRSCGRRMVSGQARPLDAGQGYTTVGIRLVRER